MLMSRNAYATYFFGTKDEIADLYKDSQYKEMPIARYKLGAIGELAGAYLICYAFPLTSLFLAADGIVRLMNKGKRDSPGSGLVGLVRENLSLARLKQ